MRFAGQLAAQILLSAVFLTEILGIEVIVFRVTAVKKFTVIGLYQSPKVPVTQLCATLRELLSQHSLTCNIVLGDSNVNWLNEIERRPLQNLITEFNYRQLISSYTTDNRTAIDHIYTNITDCPVTSGTFETYFTDHKVIWISIEHPNTTINQPITCRQSSFYEY